MFLVAGILVTLYFILLHAYFDSWDRIKRWFIIRARKRNGIDNLNLEDVKYLLIYTRKVFRVKASTTKDSTKTLDVNELRLSLIRNKNWKYLLNVVIILELLIITTGGIVGFIIEINILTWMLVNWYYIYLFFIPVLITLLGLYFTRKKIREMINELPADQFEDVLITLNEFKIFGTKSSKID